MKKLLFILFLLSNSSTVYANFEDLAAQINEKANEEFHRIDKNRDGSISREEYLEAVKAGKMDQPIMEKSIAAFKSIDTDENNKISFEEYQRFMNFAVQTIQNVIELQRQQNQK